MKRTPSQRLAAWLLIAAMANPGWARDTDIYHAVVTGSSAAEPNVLLIIDSSDSMNLPEGWREYPGTYDSHVEYLWNDLKVIGSSFTVTADTVGRLCKGCTGSTGLISLGEYYEGATPDATTTYGYWGGSTYAARLQIWQSVINYANATDPGDDGPRTKYRNYGDRNSLYWLPAGTPESDKRLYSSSFNQFYGADALTTFGGRVETNLSDHLQHLKRGGIDFGLVPTKYYGPNNQCQSSLPQLTPSTVFAPSTYPKNSGVFRNQQWQRYERFLNLDTSRVAAYPGTGGRALNQNMIGSYYLGYLEGSRDANNYVASIQYGPLPVALYKGYLISYAGWTDLRPDMGGYNFVERIMQYAGAAAGSFSTLPSLKAVLGVYGVDTSGVNNDDDARVVAYRSMMPHGYFDLPGSINLGAGMVTKTRACSWAAPVADGPDAITQTFSYAGTCSDGGISCDPVGSPACAALADPPACAQTVAGPYITRDFANCHWDSRNTLVTKTYSGCHWKTARDTVTVGVEGAMATYFINGTKCIGSCTGPDCEKATDEGANYCVVDPAIKDMKLPTQNSMSQNVLQSDGTNSSTSGCSTRTDNGTTYYYGGTCVGDYRDPPGTSWTTNSADACDKSVTASVTVGSSTLTDVRTDSASAGCSNKLDTSQSCDQRHGSGCPYLSCSARSSQTTTGGIDYPVANRVNDQETVMVHDCVADEGNTGPFMTRRPRLFGASGSPWGGGYRADPGDTAGDAGIMYDTAAAQRINTAPAYDVYSTNYLNWKFGAKSNGNPIGRRTRLQIAKDALTQLVDAQNGVRFGLMVFNRLDETYSTEGGNITYATQRMGTKLQTDIDAMSAAQQTANASALLNRQALISKINNLVANSQTPLTESLYEAYLYYHGDAPRFGNLTTTALAGGKVSAGCDRKAFAIAGDGSDGSDCLGNGTHPASSGNYHSPMLDLLGGDGKPASCQKNFVVMVTDGGPENDWSANDAIKALHYEKSATEIISPRTDVNTPVQSTTLNQFTTGKIPKPFGPVDAGSMANDGGYIWLDELAYYMANAKVSPASVTGVQTVSTFTIGFAGATTPVLQNTAALGHGLYFAAEDPSQLYAKLTGALDAIKAWQPISGGGTVVPISALNRAENSDNVYLGFFGPSQNTRWDGTLKKYLLSDVSTAGVAGNCGTTPAGDAVALCLTGRTSVTNDFGETTWNIEWVSKTPDVNGQYTSKVNDGALSYWTPGTTPDGGSARKGGSGAVLIAGADPSARKIYTFITDSVSSSLRLSQNPLDESNAAVSKARLGNAGMSAADRAKLINFARGADPASPACSDASAATVCTTWRDWAHADILHSKPLVFNFGGVDNEYAFYLSTDGVLHAVQTSDGSEKWAFTIEEALPSQRALMDNPATEHIIVADGSPSIFFDDTNHDGIVNGADRVMLYFGQRRGGSAYYAIDITDITDPKFVWKAVGGMGVAGQGKLCAGSGACAATSDYDEMGQTWSFPGVGKVRAKTPAPPDRPTPVLIVGGGYDPNQDNDPPAAADSMGRALYIIDGYSGALVKKFDPGNTVHGMTASIPSDAAAVNADLDAQNLLDRVYVGDTAGNLFRFDIDDADPDNWTGGRIAQLADGAPTKVLFAPALVKQQGMQAGTSVAFDAVYVGTGDREHPLKASGTADRMFMIKDKVGVDSHYTLNATPGDLVDITNVATAAAYALLNTASTKGWYYSLPGAGEKVVSMPTVLRNVLRFSTYSPLENINSCVPPGRGQLYGMDAFSGVPLDPAQYKLLPSNPRIFAGFYSQGYIGNGVPIIFHGKMYVLQVTESGEILPGGSSVVGAGAKVYWYREAER